ncbi:MAG: penicillin-binding protein activator [Pseudomonadota bacterium]
MVLAAACSSTPDPRGPIVSGPAPVGEIDPFAQDVEEAPQEARRYDRRAFVAPLHMQDTRPVRIGLLLPFSAASSNVQTIASAMFDAAQLAMFEAGDTRFLLIPKDTKGNPEGAAAAARSAFADGAEIILGPLFANSVEAVKPVADAVGAPVIAFSSDVNVAGDGVYLLSFPPEIEIVRVTDYAMVNDISRFGLLAPATDYGARVSSAFSQELSQRGGILVHQEVYEQDPDKMLAPARRLAKYSTEIIPPEMRHNYDPDNPQAAPTPGGQAYGYQAVLMPEQGTLLRALAPLLPYYNVDINRIKILGVSGWNNPRLSREPALRGGWFAAPDPEATARFNERYKAAFGSNPPKLASLSYDATLLAARLGRGNNARNRFEARAIADPNGYYGADGLFRLTPDGRVERGLAILEIQPEGIQVIDPAPKSFVTGF